MRKNIKIQASSLQTYLGDVEKNIENIKDEIIKAEKSSTNILLFPELSLTGASLYDLYEDRNLLDDCKKGLEDLKNFSKDFDLIFTAGLPFLQNEKIYDSVFLIKNGEILGLYIKENLKKREKTVFSTDIENLSLDYPLLNGENIEIDGIKIGLSIGEDEVKVIANSLVLKENGADIILNPSADPRYALSEKKLRERIAFLSKDVVYVYSSSGFGESTTDFVYNGLSMIFDEKKEKASIRYGNVSYIKAFKNEESIMEFLKESKEKREIHPFFYLPIFENRERYCEDVLEIQAIGLLTRLNHIGVSDVFLGLSGGLDSTMALLSIVKAFEIGALPKENIHVYTLPAFGTSDRTKSNAYKLSKALNLDLKEINISKSVIQHLEDIDHNLDVKDTAYENAQARERTQVLFDLANMYGGIVIGTGDLSEISQGFATFNGDHISNYSLNATLTKTELRFIVRYVAETSKNKELSEVLMDILDTPISPELVSEKDGEISQKTEEIVGPYELLDFFIAEMFDKNLEVEEILEDSYIAFEDKYDKKVIKKWLRSFYKRFTQSQFKRSASVDGASATRRSFSPRTGFLIPSDMDSDLYLKRLK